jgi:hypothetical protein
VTGLALQALTQALLDTVGDGEHLPIRASVSDDEEVGDVAQAAQVEDGEILDLLVEGGRDRVDDLGRDLRPQRRLSLR